MLTLLAAVRPRGSTSRRQRDGPPSATGCAGPRPGLDARIIRVLVSDWTPQALRAWLAEPADLHPGPHPRVHTIDDRLREIAGIRKRGYAAVDEEFEEGVVGVSAPVRDFRGLIVAPINVSAPKGRLGGRLDEAGRLALAIARELTAEFGHRGPAAPDRGGEEADQPADRHR